jgi:hypothetical protein
VFREAGEVYPSDDNFEREFAFSQERNNQKALYILRALEREERRRAAGGRSAENEPGALTVEHILPKNPGSEWDQALQADEALAEDCTYRLGNMCLLVGAGNRGLGRAHYDEKKKTYATTDIRITNSIPAHHQTWDRRAIETRQSRMARLAISIWRFQ